MRPKSKRPARADDPAQQGVENAEPLDEHQEAELRRKLIASVRHRAVGLKMQFLKTMPIGPITLTMRS